MEAGASSPRGRASRGRKRRGLALAAAGATLASASASPARASVAPPPKITLPTIDRATWTDAVLVAPTKAGKLKRKKGGGGGGGGDDAENVDPDRFGPGDFEADSGGSDGEGGDFGGGEGSGGGGDDGSGGSGGSGDSGDEWLESYGGAPEDGNLLWAWHTLCGVAFASSVQHFVDTSVSAATGARVAAAEEAAAAAAAAAVAAAAGVEAVTAAHARLCLASLGAAHLARQPRLCISAR
jgi:hypothetical protein